MVNRSVETYLRCFAGNTPKKWSRVLPWAEYWYNTTYHSATGTTPFKALYGRDPPTLLRWVDQSSKVQEVDQLIKERNQLLDELKEQLQKAQSRMKSQADKRRREVEYEKGDLVYLKLKPYMFKSLAKKPNEKLAPRYYGPFAISDKISKVAYQLILPPSARIHNVFHVSQLKRALKPPMRSQPLPRGLTEELELVVEPEEIVAARRSRAGTPEILVKWVNLPEHENTWEDLMSFQAQFPKFYLEDKVLLAAVGDDGLDVF